MPVKVYYIEDDVGYAALFEQTVVSKGWRCEVILDPRKAVHRMASLEDHDWIVIDMAFDANRYRGAEVLTSLKKIHEHVLNHVIVFTACDDDDTHERLKEVGFTGPIVGKMFGISAVIKEIEDRMRRPARR